MIDAKKYQICAPMWLWFGGKAAWTFITIPKDISDEIYFAAKLRAFGKARGFGSIKVRVKIGNSVFQTSLFPSNQEKCYLLPVKKTVREAEKLEYDKEIKLSLELV